MADGPELSVQVFGPERRKRGRPKAEVPCTALTAWVPTAYHDKLIKMANDRHMSVSSLVKQILVLKIQKFDPPKG